MNNSLKDKLMKVGSVLFIAVIAFIWFSKKFKSSAEPTSAAQVEEKIFISPGEQTAYQSKIDMKTKIDKKLNKERIGKNKARASSDFFNRASSAARKPKKKDVVDQEQPEELVEEVQQVQEETTVQKTRIVYVPVEKETVEQTPEPVNKKPVYRKAGFRTINGSDSQSSKILGSDDVADAGVELQAVVQRDGFYKSNDVVRLRTTSEVVINGIKIPKNTYLDGIANVNENRIFITVKGYTVNGRQVNRNLQAYSLSGGRGLQLNSNSTKGAGKEVIKNSANQVVQRVKLPINLGGTAGSLAKDKVEEKSAKLSAGTKMILRSSV